MKVAGVAHQDRITVAIESETLADPTWTKSGVAYKSTVIAIDGIGRVGLALPPTQDAAGRWHTIRRRIDRQDGVGTED